MGVFVPEGAVAEGGKEVGRRNPHALIEAQFPPVHLAQDSDRNRQLVDALHGEMPLALQGYDRSTFHDPDGNADRAPGNAGDCGNLHLQLCRQALFSLRRRRGGV